MSECLPAFVSSVPEYEVIDGQMHIAMGPMALVMPIDVFMSGCRLGEAAIAKWHRTICEAEVIPFPREKRFERVYDPRGHI